MSRFLSLVFALVFVLSSLSPALAQTATSTPPPSLPDVAATSPLNCFDYYTFGSVQADLVPQVAQTVPGALLTFTGEVKSTNPYPLLDGTLYVKIFHRNEKTFAEGDGNEVVDQFVVKDNITLPPNGTLPVQYEWKVPVNAEGGEYYAAYFFTTAHRYNLMGLSFTDDVVGNQAPFTVTTPEDSSAVAKLSKISTSLNGKDHHFAAFPLHFAAGDTVTVKTTITNPTKTAKTLPLQWNQYAWDAINKDNIRFTKTEVVTLKPNETKEVSYEIQAQRESVVYVVAVTQDLEVKSILNVRYVRDGIEETRINFPGVTKFPLAKDSTETLFACAHSTNQPVVPGNILTLTLKDRGGSTIHEYKYEGDIVGAMSGFGDIFTPTKNINYATLTATLERNGVIVEQVTQTYDCEVIDSGSCLPEEQSAASVFDYLKTHLMTILLTAVVLLLLGAIITLFIKKRRNHIDASGGIPMTTPLSLLFFLLLLPTMFFMQPGTGEAKSVSWTGSITPDLFYCWNYGGGACVTAKEYSSNYVNWFRGLGSAQVTVRYYAEIVNVDTGAIINDTDSISVGTKIRLRTSPHLGDHVDWFGTGYSNDSPNGEWISSATRPPAPTYTYNDFFTGAPITETSYCAPQYFVGSDSVTGYPVYIPLSINPPLAKATTVSSNLSCGTQNIDVDGTLTQDCTVASVGNITVGFNIPSTYAKFYYGYYHPGQYVNFAQVVAPGCKANSTAMRTAVRSPITNYGEVLQAGLSASDYTLNVPQQTITFNLTAAAAANTAPINLTITGPTTGVINTAYTFNLTATDPENNTLRYGIDWDNNGSVDEWVPGTGYVNSGTSQSSNRSWATDGSYSFQALAQDSNGASSGWVGHTISIGAPIVPGASCVVTRTLISDADGTNAGIQDMRTASECKASSYLATTESGGTALYASYRKCPLGVVDGGTSSIGACFGDITFTPNSGPASRCFAYSYECVAPVASCIVPNASDDTIIDSCAASAGGGYSRPADFSFAFVIQKAPSDYTVCQNNKLIATQACSGGEFAWDGQSMCQGSFPACTPTVTTADLKINNSDGPVSVPKNTSVNLTWTSANAVSCTKWGGAWGSGQGIALSGSDTTIVAASGTYMINCGGVIDSVDVVVVNQTPNPPTIAGTCTQAGVNNTFTITGSDPDNDNLFYEVDWNNDGTVDATTMTVTSGQSQPATYNWPTAGSYTFQARTVDAPPGGQRSAWTAHNVNCPAAPAVLPAVTIQVRVNAVDWTANDTSIDPGDIVKIRWLSTDATSCTGTNVSTGNAANNSPGVDVTEPTPGNYLDYKVDCTGPGGTISDTIRVTTRQIPNFNKPLVNISSFGTFDPVTATYASVNVYFSTANNGGSVTKSSAPYMVELTGYPTQSGTIPSGLASGPIGYNNTVTIPGPLSFGTANIKVSIDTPISSNGSVAETIEGDADNTNTTSLAITPPDPGLSITADRTRLRNGETTIIRWNIATPYTGLACEVYGPGMSINPATFSDDEPTQPISAKSEYTLKCTVAGTTFQKSVFVETEGEIEEI